MEVCLCVTNTAREQNKICHSGIESPPYFCVASETGRDTAEEYIETPIGSLNDHKFLPHTQGMPAYQAWPRKSLGLKPNSKHVVEVYMDDYIKLATATTQEHLDHVANGIMCRIHDVFPPESVETEDPISF